MDRIDGARGAEMKWRRGLLLAGIHLAIALSVTAWSLWREARDTFGAVSGASVIRLAAFQEEQTVDFSPMNCDGYIEPESRVVIFANLPASIVTGVDDPCPARWQLSGLIKPKSVGGLWYAIGIVDAVF